MLVKMHEMKSEKGFTLIELMIVIAIIGILAAIAIPQFSAYRSRGYVASMKADCNSVRTAEEAYFVDNNTYTTTTDDLPGLPSAFSTGNTVAVTAGTGGIAKDFVVTVTDTTSGRTGKTVTYTSSTGQTE